MHTISQVLNPPGEVIDGELAPLAAEGQQPTHVPRIGLLFPGSPGPSSAVEAFRQGLREHGYVEGQNILLENRFARGQLDPLPILRRSWSASRWT